MPVTHLIHPIKGTRLEFADAPRVLEEDSVMPSYAVEAIIAEHRDEKPAFNVRPSDVAPAFVCRRQRTWMATHDYGINPLEAEGMLEGSALHEQLGTHEISVPEPHFSRELDGDGNQIVYEDRIEVMGVPMRGRLDWLFPDRIEDLKTKTPFWAVKFGPKGSGERPYAYIWEPKSDDDDIKGWQLQLSIYRILLLKSGQEAPAMGRVWRRYSGVKADKPRWKRYDFPLLDEAGLDAVVGDWVRGLSEGLSAAEVKDPEAWRGVPADGLAMVGSRGNKWCCERCPASCKKACDDVEGTVGW